MKLYITAPLALALSASLLTGCKNEPVDPCQVNPTRQAQDGSWVEADGEPLDDDPCDSDDLDSDGYKKKPTPAKTPAAKTTKGTTATKTRR